METFAFVVSFAGVLPHGRNGLEIHSRPTEITISTQSSPWLHHGEEPDWRGHDQPFCCD